MWTNATNIGKKPPSIETANAKRKLLVVSPCDSDHITLEKLLPQTWMLSHAADLPSAVVQLQTPGPTFPVVLCERDLGRNSWRELLDHLRHAIAVPLLIVSSRFADERLWAEALNVGAYDVLAKPFERDEVNRVLASAWSRWSRERALPGFAELLAPALQA